MLYSMTGYGRDEQKNNLFKIIVEIKSLNSKAFDMNIKMPAYLKSFEMPVRNIANEKLQRGKIDLFINIDWSEDILNQLYDVDEIKKYFLQLKTVAGNLTDQNTSNPYLEATLFKEAFNQVQNQNKYEKQVLTEENTKLIFETISNAIQSLNHFRKTEGEKLEADILNQIGLLESVAKKIKELESLRTRKIKDKILNTLTKNFDESKINKDRLEQEIIYYLEKLDINEELVRLSSHIQYFREVCKNGYNMGRKLSFIAQEMGREINTIGSKANDEHIQKLVVEMKDLLEKTKEQLNNIL